MGRSNIDKIMLQVVPLQIEATKIGKLRLLKCSASSSVPFFFATLLVAVVAPKPESNIHYNKAVCTVWLTGKVFTGAHMSGAGAAAAGLQPHCSMH